MSRLDIVIPPTTPILNPQKDELRMVRFLRDKNYTEEDIQKSLYSVRHHKLRDKLLSDRNEYEKIPHARRKQWLKRHNVHPIVGDDTIWINPPKPWFAKSWKELTGEDISDFSIRYLMPYPTPKLVVTEMIIGFYKDLIASTPFNNDRIEPVVKLTLQCILHINAVIHNWPTAIRTTVTAIKKFEELPDDPSAGIVMMLDKNSMPRLKQTPQEFEEYALCEVSRFLFTNLHDLLIPSETLNRKTSLLRTIMVHYTVLLASIKIGDLNKAKSHCVTVTKNLSYQPDIADNLTEIFIL